MQNYMDKNMGDSRYPRFAWRRGVKWMYLYIFGGLAYGALEILWRGRTHISMLLLGGLCFVLLMRLTATPYKLFTKCVIGATIITCLEFIVGYIVNIRMGLNVWNYSMRPFNIMGQICPQYWLVWFLLSGIVFVGYSIIAQAYRKLHV